MKTLVKILLLCLLPAFSMAQTDPSWGYVTTQQADNLKRSLQTEKNDTIKLAAFRSLGFYYQDFKPDSGLYFHEQQLALSKKLKMNLWQADAYSQAGYVFNILGNFMKSYEYHSEAMKLAGDEKNESDNWRPWTFSNATNAHEARIAIGGMNYQMVANLWGNMGEFEKRKASLQESVKLGESINNGKIIFIVNSQLASTYSPDSALLFLKKSIEIAAKAGFNRVGNTYFSIASKYIQKSIWDSALIFAHKAAARLREDNELIRLTGTYYLISRIFREQKLNDSSLFYAKKTFETSQLLGSYSNILTGYYSLFLAYNLINNQDSAYKYISLVSRLNDSLKNARIASLTEYQKFSFNEQLRLKKLDEEKTAYANKMNTLGLLAVLGGILVVAVILYRNNRQKQKANKVLETTLTNLKSTQSQLIQSEKMASLGELTAGIAHEIQNPLNFVNNFSELNKELLDEMKDEMNKGNLDDANAIANNVIDNSEKINHHGKRAGDIVKGMLQHSRSSSGQKEPTDINALCDEYLRLSYHGLRAKDKSFNATMITDFDKAIGNINIIPQDIGRVILNLINNAFYVVNEKALSAVVTPTAAKYDPTVSVSTKKIGNKSDNYRIEIKVADNSNGIPQKILDKIFQPFFTTKPTGQGTGLGLSLSYDIVKAHGGELKVETKEGKGSTFTIKLPVN